MTLGRKCQLGSQQPWPSVSPGGFNYFSILQVSISLADLTGAAIQGDVPDQFKGVVCLHYLRSQKHIQEKRIR